MESQMGELEQIAIAKAQVLGFNWAEVKPFPDSVNDSKSEPVADFRVNDGIVTILISPDSEVMNRDIREAFAENLLCACRNVEDGMYERGKPSTGDPVMDIVVAEMCGAYSGYFTAQRQMQIFGAESVRKFHEYSLMEMTKMVDSYVMRNIGMRNEQHVAIFSLMGGQILAGMLGQELPVVPRVMADIAEPLPWAFEKINSSGLVWDDKLKVIYAATKEMVTGLLIPESYLAERIVQQDERSPGTSLELAERGMLKGDALFKAIEVEKYMRATYLGNKNAEQASEGHVA